MMVATQEKEVMEELENVPGTPLLHLRQNGLCFIQPHSTATLEKADKIQRKKLSLQ